LSLLAENGTEIATTATDSNGKYLFEDIPAGTYTIVITDTTDELDGLVGTQDPDSVGTPDMQSTVTTNGIVDNLSQNFGFAPPSVSDIGATIYLDEDGDGTQDSNEPGIEGVTVSLLAENGTEIATSVTDSNGKYLLEDLPPGTYTVVVTDIADELDGLVGDRTSTLTTDGVTDDLDDNFSFTPPPSVSDIGDKIYLDEDADSTQDSNEPGIEGVTVTLLDADGTTVIATTVTDSNGKYLFEGFPAGTYTVLVTDAADKLDGLVGTQDPDSSASLDKQSTLTTNGIVDNLDQDFGFTPLEEGAVADIGDTIYLDGDANSVQDAN